jgi:hypothetical protein
MSRRDDEDAEKGVWKCHSHVDPCTRKDAKTPRNLRGDM